MEAQCYVPLQFFLQLHFSFSPVTFTCSGCPFHCGGHCIPMKYKSSLESFCLQCKIPAEAVVEAQCYVPLQFFLQLHFSFSPVTFTCSGCPFHCGGHCIPMKYKSSLESFCSASTNASWHTRTTMQSCWL